MLAAGWLAVWRTALSAPQRLDLPGDDILQLATRRLRAFPLPETALVPVAVVVLTATLFMLNPGGLRTSLPTNPFGAGRADAKLQRGWNASRLTGAACSRTAADCLCAGRRLAVVEDGAVTYIDRFAAAWALIGALALLLYPGATPADAMWVVLPLTLLAATASRS